MPSEEDFDIMFETRCVCGEEDLEWEWVPEELKFEAECSACLKRHYLIPKTATIQFDVDSGDAVEEDW